MVWRGKKCPGWAVLVYVIPPLSPWQVSVSKAEVPAQIMLPVIPLYTFEQSALAHPVTVATFRSGDCAPLEETVPQPLMIRLVPTKVWLTSGGKHAIPTVLEVTAGVSSFKRAKSKSSVLEL